MRSDRFITYVIIAIAVLAIIFIAAFQSIDAQEKEKLGTSTVERPTIGGDFFEALSMTGVGDGYETEITVYNQNIALVKERRSVDLDEGLNLVEYVDIPSRIDPTSVILEDTRYPGTFVVEQSYRSDIVSNRELLESYIDRQIEVTDSTGKSYKGILLSHRDGIIISTDGEVVAINDVAKIEFPDTTGLLTKPTLIWQIYTPESGQRDILTSYLTEGMTWRANYILKTDADEKQADVAGWVTIDNNAGTDFSNAKLKLVAGDINRVFDRPVFFDFEVVAEEAAFEAPADQFVQEGLSEFQLYTLERNVTLLDDEEKQISLFSAEDVTVDTEFIFDGSRDSRVQSVLSMENSEDDGLGVSMPAGTIRIYKPDSTGQLQFIGEDSIGHTPVNEEIRVSTGFAFDITGSRIQTDFQRISENRHRTSYEIEISNQKSEVVDVTVVERLFGDWEIIESSDDYTKVDARTIEFEVTVPARTTTTITYTAEFVF